MLKFNDLQSLFENATALQAKGDGIYEAGKDFAFTSVLPSLPDVYVLGQTADSPGGSLLQRLGVTLESLAFRPADRQIALQAVLQPPPALQGALALSGINAKVPIKGTITVPLTGDAPTLDGGVARLQDPTQAPGLLLEATADISALGDLGVDSPYLRLYTPLDEAWLARNPTYEPQIWTGFQLQVGEKISMDVAAELPLGTFEHLTLRGRFAPIPLGSPAELAALVGGDDFAASLPKGMKLADLGTLEIEDVSLTVTTTKPSIASASIRIRTTGKWKAVPGQVEVDGPTVEFRVLDPFGEARSASVRLSGSFEVIGRKVDFATGLPEFYVSARLSEPATFPLSKLTAAYPGVPSIGDLTVDSLSIGARPQATPKSFSIDARLASAPEAWSIAVGKARLELANVALTLQYAGDAGLSGKFAATSTLASVELATEMAFGGSNAKFRAEMGPVDLATLVKEVSSGALTLPFALELSKSTLLLEKDGDAYSMQLGSVVDGFGSVFVALVRKDVWGAAAGFALADDFDFGKLGIPDFRRYVPLEKLALVASTVELPRVPFPDPVEVGLEAGSGVNLPATIDKVPAGLAVFATLGGSNESIDRLRSVIGLESAQMAAAIIVSEEPKLSVGMVGTLRDSATTFLGALEVGVANDTPEVALNGAFTTKVKNKDLICSAKLMATPNGAELSGNVTGSWDNAFDVKGLTLSDMGLTIGVNLEGIPTVGIMGTLTAGKLNGSLAILFDSKVPANSLLAGSLSDLKMGEAAKQFSGGAVPDDIATVLDQMQLIGEPRGQADASIAAALDTERMTAAISGALDKGSGGAVKLPTGERDVLIVAGEKGKRWYLTDRATFRHYTVVKAGPTLKVSEDVQLQISPNGGAIGTAKFTKGIRLLGGVSVFGTKGEFNLEVDETAKGLVVDATMTPIDLGGVVKIAAAKGRGGPVLSVATYDAKTSAFPGPHVVISGEATVLGTGVALDLRATKSGLTFKFTRKLFDLFEADVGATAKLDDLSKASFSVTAKMKNDLTAKLQAEATTAIDKATKAARDDLGKAIKDVTDAQKSLDTFDPKIAAAKAQVKKEQSANAGEVTKAQKKVDGIRSTIRVNEKKIADAEKEIKDNPLKSVTLGPKIIAWGTALTAEKATLVTANGILEAAKKLAKAPPVEADPRVASLITAQGTAKVTLEAAKQTLKLLRTGTGAMGEAAEWIVKNSLGGVIDVKAAAFTGALSAVNGGKVSMSATVALMSKPQTIAFAFNFNDVGASVATFAKQAVAQL